MNKPVHGGGVDRAMGELGLPREAIYDFSASINPLGPPPEVEQVLIDALQRIRDYPEIEAASLRRELEDFHGISETRLLPGSGSTELIYLLPRVFRPRRALLILPCFSEYAPALRQVGCHIDTVALSPEHDFYFSVEQIVNGLREDTDLVVLANPGNPTGVGIESWKLLELARRLGSCRLLLDEAFVDFCPEYSILEQVGKTTNLLVLRSMTKFYAIPGLRVGYLAGSDADIAKLAAQKEPWSLSNLAIAAGVACLAVDHFREQTLARIGLLREGLKQGLEKLGMKVFPARANYLLCRLPQEGPDAIELKRKLYRHGILVRSCEDFNPLDARYLRLAVLGKEANTLLLGRLASIFSRSC
ncbi:threonine-phosphate decarboxylase CobD [Malonomonas rubra]|uniref:threonine-phosphate decarboxylase CobD n=1 Tax=Malonomonas rubra TaxID=57040 RepID=UPI0026E96373|nr:threonine-phosphate decarboxylase CobD [Malonomonas rubra]